MFYLSRGEQVALVLLLALLLAGAGLLTYERGIHAGKGEGNQPIFVDAPSRPAPDDGAAALPPAGASSPAERGALGAPAAGGHGNARPTAPAQSPDHPGGRPDVVEGMRASSRPAGSGTAQPLRRISLNHATADQLDRLPGIGPIYASRIIEYRERKKREKGQGFESVDELLNVPGIGPKRLAALRDRVTP